MACKLTAVVAGGQTRNELEANTVGDLITKLGLDGTYSAMVNGRPADVNTRLQDYNHVTFAPAVKGGR